MYVCMYVTLIREKLNTSQLPSDKHKISKRYGTIDYKNALTFLSSFCHPAGGPLFHERSHVSVGRTFCRPVALILDPIFTFLLRFFVLQVTLIRELGILVTHSGGRSTLVVIHIRDAVMGWVME